ncbi:hypothetical protein E2P81_ATG04460 [Venturia nashicola]|nr:hypothetical protein E2P81_ATG04460 [Venturia nashicola]
MRVAIDPDGDVLLVVGKHESQVSLQVSSKVLSVASKMFKAMFFGHFKEAVELASSTTPYQVLLPDDEPVAMVALCSVLHHVEFAPDLSVLNLSAFAGVADKYDAIKACKLAGKAWLDHIYLQTTGISSFLLIEILCVAYIFEDYQNFKKISKRVLVQPDGYQRVRDFISDAVSFPDSVPNTFAALRRDTEDMISEHLMDPITVMARGRNWYNTTDHTSNKGGLSSCKHDAAKSYDYTWELMQLGLWPIVPRKWNLETVVQSLAAFKGKTTAQAGILIFPNFGAKCSACSCDTVHRMDTLKKLVEEKLKGLCLDCFRAGVAQGTGKGCRALSEASKLAFYSTIHQLYTKKQTTDNRMAEPQAKRPRLADSKSTPMNRKVDSDPDGDVILVVGTDEPGKMSIKVSSKVLSISSKVFKAMFSRNFKEGNELARSSTLYEVPLPDDDPDAMSTLCNILHHNTDDLSFPDDTDKLMEFVTVMDKYNCAKASKIYVVPWIEKFHSPSLSQMADLLWVSHNLRYNNSFRKFSSMLLHSDHGVKTLREFQIKETSFPLEIYSLANRRLELDHWLVHNLSMQLTKIVALRNKENSFKWETHTAIYPKCHGSSVVEYIAQLEVNGLWPIEPLRWDFNRTMEALGEFQIPESGRDRCANCAIDINKHIENLAIEFRSMLDKGVTPRAKLSESSRVVVDPDGDVLLAVGEQDSKVSIRVPLKVLSVMLKVFKAYEL